MGPAYRIVSPRLVIRCYQPSDAPLLKRAVDESLEHLRPWMPWVAGEPKPLADKVQLVRRLRGQLDLGIDTVYAILDPSERQLIGGTGLHPRVGEGAREIGYWIHPAHLGQGLAVEAVLALTRVGFEVERLSRLEIHCDPLNRQSARVAEKAGYRHEATLERRTRRPDGSERDTMIWTQHVSEYPASPAGRLEVGAWDVSGEVLL
jgi:RimJ/RimL family protein N-acetyltransferase